MSLTSAARVALIGLSAVFALKPAFKPPATRQSNSIKELLAKIPEVVEGTHLNLLVPGASELNLHLDALQKQVEHVTVDEELDVPAGEARAAFLEKSNDTHDTTHDTQPSLGSSFPDGNTCDMGYFWWENCIGIKTTFKSPRITSGQLLLNLWKEYQGQKWGEWACSYGVRFDLNRTKPINLKQTWELKSLKWTYAKPGNKCPLARNEDFVKPTRGHLSIYFTIGNYSDPKEGTKIPWSSGIGIDVRPQCWLAALTQRATGTITPEAVYQSIVPQGGWGPVWWGDVLRPGMGYVGAVRIIYRTPHFPNFYSWAVIWFDKLTKRPTSWAITLGHRHVMPEYKPIVDPRELEKEAEMAKVEKVSVGTSG